MGEAYQRCYKDVCTETVMKVIVQELSGKLFLQETGIWTESRPEAKRFSTALEAISFCIHCKAKEVRLLGQNENGEDVFLYPFGGDPAVKVERKRLRRELAEGRRLKAEQQEIHARMDMLLSESKERDRRSPLECKQVAKED